jgi:AraC-like DNA-binding protein
MAAIAGLSRAAFAALLRKEVGQAPMTYLRHYRLAAATRKLEEGTVSIEHAARSAGYRNTSAFRRSLRRSLAPAASRSPP